MSKYKYYFCKPRSEIVKDILKGLIITGAVCIAATSPYFAINLLKGFGNKEKYKPKKVYDTFYNLKRQGYINIKNKNRQIYISLTQEGRKKAGSFQIDSLKISKPRKWDKKWRIVLFDISHFKTLQRNAFRGKLKELGFSPFQKSVWVHPFPCKDEIFLLREFFGLGPREICLITTEDIEGDGYLRRAFGLS